MLKMEKTEAAVQRLRSSRQEVFYEKGVLRNFTKLTGKHLCQSLFFNKVAGLRHRCFPVNFAKFLRTSFLTEPLWWTFIMKELIKFTIWLLQSRYISYRCFQNLSCTVTILHFYQSPAIFLTQFLKNAPGTFQFL